MTRPSPPDHHKSTREQQPPGLHKVTCTLFAHSASPHLQQLYTGFSILHAHGAIELRQQIVKAQVDYAQDAPHLKGAEHAHLAASLGEGLRLHFDTHDSAEVALGNLRNCDVYFKRSYSRSYAEGLPPNQRHKVRPLGMNYRVLPDHIDRFALQRASRLHPGLERKMSALREAIDVRNVLSFRPRLARMQAAPVYELEPRVLFLVTAYDPHDDPARSREKISERAHINETRAECLRRLQRELGTRFYGGFTGNAYTQAQYKDLVVPSEVTAQKSYLETLRRYPICVATMGLHGSTGWKLAEYVAFAKAILSEPLHYEAPGSFGPGRNFLEFTSPDECVEGAVRLLEDDDLRHGLMAENARYYEQHLRPDALVWNALTAALSEPHAPR